MDDGEQPRRVSATPIAEVTTAVLSRGPSSLAPAAKGAEAVVVGGEDEVGGRGGVERVVDHVPCGSETRNRPSTQAKTRPREGMR